MKYQDVDPKVKRFFPWALFLVLAALLALATTCAHAQDQDPYVCYGAGRYQAMSEGKPACPSCEDVVAKVGLQPLWVAERRVRKEHPEITESQIAWGRRCVIDHRKAMVKGIINKIEGAF